jgi:hypothetical protein
MKRHNYGVNKCYNSTFFSSHDSFFFFFFFFTPNISSSILLQTSTTPQFPSSPHQTHLPSFSFSSAFSSPSSIPIPLLHLLTLLPTFFMCLLLAVHILSSSYTYSLFSLSAYSPSISYSHLSPRIIFADCSTNPLIGSVSLSNHVGKPICWRIPTSYKNFYVYYSVNVFVSDIYWRSQWPSGLRRVTTADRLLGLRV